MWCERSVLATRGSSAPATGRILCYHSVGTPSWGVNDVSPARFRHQLELALSLGYRFVPAAKIAGGGGGPRDLAVSFDDGLASVADNAAPVLTALRIPWTLFVVSNWADGKHGFGDGVMLGWRQIERLAAAGAAIGSHSVSHADFGRLTAEQALIELCDSRDTIAARLGIAPQAFAIPLGQTVNWTEAAGRAAKLAGYDQIYAQTERRRPPGTVPRTFITCFDNARIYAAALRGAFDGWEEWL